MEIAASSSQMDALDAKKMDGKLAGDDRPQGQNSAKDQNRMLSLPRLWKKKLKQNEIF